MKPVKRAGQDVLEGPGGRIVLYKKQDRGDCMLSGHRPRTDTNNLPIRRSGNFDSVVLLNIMEMHGQQVFYFQSIISILPTFLDVKKNYRRTKRVGESHTRLVGIKGTHAPCP